MKITSISDLSLTPKETEIAPFVAQGLSYKIIAGKTGISVHTLEVHLRNIRRKCGKSSTFETGCFLARFYI